MIIELPGLPSKGANKRYRMGFYHFSNNNLAIRRQCAIDVGMYDPAMRTSEDVDLCFRVAASPDWVACREPGVVVRHKARRTLGGMVKQLWGWGINLGRAYRKTGIKGIYLHWVSSTKHTVSHDLQTRAFPLLVCAFVTAFHVAHWFAAAAVVLASFGLAVPAAITGVLALLLLARSMRDVAHLDLSLPRRIKLAGVFYVGNVVFVTASFLSGLRFGMILICASTFPPTQNPARDLEEGSPDQ